MSAYKTVWSNYHEDWRTVDAKHEHVDAFVEKQIRLLKQFSNYIIVQNRQDWEGCPIWSSSAAWEERFTLWKEQQKDESK